MTLTHFVLIRAVSDSKVLETVHRDSASEASSLYDDTCRNETRTGITVELRDRFGIRAARTL